MISFIVSAFGEKPSLMACLACLGAQDGDNQVIVCDNNPGFTARSGIRIPTGSYGARNCYESALMVFGEVNGDWLCFPSDDSLYVRDFSRIMIETAVRKQADLVYCDMVYKCGTEKNGWLPYSVLKSEPRMGRIDKTNFILRRELFRGFPEHPQQWRDGALIEQVIRDGAKHAKAPGVLVVHQ